MSNIHFAAPRQFARTMSPEQRELWLAMHGPEMRGAGLDQLKVSDEIQGEVELHTGVRKRPDAETLLVANVRYFLARSTVGVHLCTDHVLGKWDELSAPTKELLVNEIKTALGAGRVGQDVDARAWSSVLARAAIPSEPAPTSPAP